jgi:hypothetical protein
LGIVLRRTPGVTRWARWSWKATAVLPGAGPADWCELRREGTAREYHAATLPLELHGAETEAYLHGLFAEVPSVYVIMRPVAAGASGEAPLELVLVTASPYEAQDYADSGEEIIEKVPMPEGLRAWVADFVETHHTEEEFKKRRRDRVDVEKCEDGVGDPRVSKLADVYRAPRPEEKGRLQ